MANSHGPGSLGGISGGASPSNVAFKTLVFHECVNEVDKACGLDEVHYSEHTAERVLQSREWSS